MQGTYRRAPLAATDEYALVLSRVANLDHVDDGDGPTEHAVASAINLLSAVHPLLRSSFPLAAVSTTDDGGIHVYWERPERTLLLSVPPDSGALGFIYHRDRDGYAADKDVTPHSLAHWIRWLAAE